MERKSRMGGRGARGQRRSQGVSAMLAALGRRFARFREQHPRGTRVPPDVRAAALAAVARGAALGDVARTCAVSRGQLRAWEAGTGKAANLTGTEAVRVFSVVDAPAVSPEPPAAAVVEDRLELRLGPWSVSVRLAGGG